MIAEDLIGGERQMCTCGSFAMVAVPQGKSPDWRLPAIPAEVPEPAGDGLTMTDIVFADQANSFGKMFGGDALAVMTKAAFVAASRRSRMITVLASSRRIDFKHPISVGSIIDVIAKVVHTGRSSATVPGRSLVGNTVGRWPATDSAWRIRHGIGRTRWPFGRRSE